MDTVKLKKALSGLYDALKKYSIKNYPLLDSDASSWQQNLKNNILQGREQSYTQEFYHASTAASGIFFITRYKKKNQMEE